MLLLPVPLLPVPILPETTWFRFFFQKAVVFSRIGTDKNSTNRKVGKMAQVFSNIWVGVWSLKKKVKVHILGLYLGFWSLGDRSWDRSLGSRIGDLGWRV